MAKKFNGSKATQGETDQSVARLPSPSALAPVKPTPVKRKRAATMDTKTSRAPTSRESKFEPEIHQQATFLGPTRNNPMPSGKVAPSHSMPQGGVKTESLEVRANSSPFMPNSAAQFHSGTPTSFTNLPAAPPNVLNPTTNLFIATQLNPVSISMITFVISSRPDSRNLFDSKRVWDSNHLDELANRMWQTAIAEKSDSLHQISNATAMYPYPKLQVFATLNWLPSWCWLREQAVCFLKSRGRPMDDRRHTTQIGEALDQIRKANIERANTYETKREAGAESLA